MGAAAVHLSFGMLALARLPHAARAGARGGGAPAPFPRCRGDAGMTDLLCFVRPVGVGRGGAIHRGLDGRRSANPLWRPEDHEGIPHEGISGLELQPAPDAGAPPKRDLDPDVLNATRVVFLWLTLEDSGFFLRSLRDILRSAWASVRGLAR